MSRAPEERPLPAAPGAGVQAAGRTVVTCWGVRGSLPAPGPDTVRHGGNTPCLEVIGAGGARLVLDAGTGIRVLGSRAPWLADAAARPATIDVLVTHAHADHVQGLPFFAPLLDDGATVVVHAGAGVAAAVEQAARTLLLPPLFPVPLDRLPARLRFAALDPAAEAVVGGFAVRCIEVAHPGGAYGFRITDPASGATLCYLPDDELAAVEGVGGGRRTLLAAIAGSALLVHDATYLPAELPQRRGWGHSSYAEAIRLAADAGVPRLLLFHHHPARDDAALDRLAHSAASIGAAHGVVVEVAREEVPLAL